MTATGIVAFFSALSAASSGAHGSLGGMLAMLIACRLVAKINFNSTFRSCRHVFVGLADVFDPQCDTSDSSSGLASELNIPVVPLLLLSSLKVTLSQKMLNTAGSPLQLIV